MVKYCCNNFHALKITFANETARLCEALAVDPFEVMDLVCKDRQLNISPAYLKPGFAFGGSCLPKDLRATLYFAKTRDVEVPMLRVPIRPGRNMTSIIEVAARNMLLKIQGHHSAREFQERLNKAIAEARPLAFHGDEVE